MVQLFRPPPPKTNGFKSLVILVTLILFGVFVVWEFSSKPALPPAQPAPRPAPTPAWVEVDLRGPFYDRGRSEGAAAGLLAGKEGQGLPADAVLEFQGGEGARAAALTAENDQRDFVAGYRSGYVLGWTEARKTAGKK